MKKLKTILLKMKYVLLALIVTISMSCSGDDGEMGSPGLNGTNGIDGEDGNANVMYSDWFKPPTYNLSTGFGGINLLEHDEAASEITQEILDTGVVLVYGNLRGYTTSIWPFQHVALLPLTLTYGVSPTNIDTWTALLSVGNIKIRFINNNNTYNSLGTSHEFRYIIIPSSDDISASKSDNKSKNIVDELSEAGVDINNYEEVLSYYGK